MKKSELLELVAKLEMKPLMKVDQSTECYGETVVIAEHQIGYTLESKDLVPDLESIVNDLWSGYFLPVTAVRELQPWEDNYKYTVYAPANWFREKKEEV